MTKGNCFSRVECFVVTFPVVVGAKWIVLMQEKRVVISILNRVRRTNYCT